MLGGILGSLGLIIILVIVGRTSTVKWNNLAGYIVAMSNTFGISCEIFLLGFGLVEIPRAFFRRSNTDASTRKLGKQLTDAARDMEKAYTELLRLLGIFRQLRAEVPNRHEHYWALCIIDEDINRAAPFEIDEKALEAEQENALQDMEYDYEELSDLATLRCSTSFLSP